MPLLMNVFVKLKYLHTYHGQQFVNNNQRTGESIMHGMVPISCFMKQFIIGILQ